MTASPSPIPAHQPTFAELYTPTLVTILRQVEFAETAAAAIEQIKTSPTIAS